MFLNKLKENLYQYKALVQKTLHWHISYSVV